ncbi:MAG TPA: alpha-amylase family glycosyl hydrolase [Terracidiphilus sp.]|nr:alpha-amylase family glycosyl hydrolase [Terracidiphilus sp.]
MKLHLRLSFSAFILLICGIPAAAQSSPACPAAQTASAPCIDKIDPPGWWAGLPDPMLLLHGSGFSGVQFTVSGTGVSIVRTQISQNGHWAFLWLDTKSAAAETLRLTASNAQGSVQRSYPLAARDENAAHAGFSSADVMYLIMTDRFARAGSPVPPGDDRQAPRGWHGGNFQGIEQHLDYLQQLGVTTLWTTPVASNANMQDAYHGYAATDLYTVDSHFGTLQDYQHLSDALHARGMKLVIDLVPNHVGVNHPWISDPPTPDWLHGTLQNHLSVQSDFDQLVDPHAAPAASLRITNGWFTNAMPDLNQENPLVSQYLIQNAIWWIETAHLDGIRLDTFPYVSRAFWHDYHAALHAVYPHLTTVGEVFNGDAEITSYFAGGVKHKGIDTGLDTPFDFPTYFALRDTLAHDKSMTELATVLRKDALYPHPERLVPFIGNHDTTRFYTESGNSAPRLKLALGLAATLRGMPEIYSGDEIGMAGGADPDNRRDFPGGFPGDPQSAFTQAGRTALQQDVFGWTSGMLALRASHAALKTGMEQDLFADNDGFAFVRSLDLGGCSQGGSSDPAKAELLIVLNKSAQSKTLDLPMTDTALAGCTAFTALAPALGNAPVVSGGTLQIEEPAESLSVYEVR